MKRGTQRKKYGTYNVRLLEAHHAALAEESLSERKSILGILEEIIEHHIQKRAAGRAYLEETTLENAR